MSHEPDDLIAEVRSYGELMAVFRTRSEENHITREDVDARGGLQSGYAGKLLAPSYIKAVGPTSLGPLLGVLRLKLWVLVDNSLPPLPPARRKRINRASRRATSPATT